MLQNLFIELIFFFTYRFFLDISSFIIPYSRLNFLSQIGSGSTSIVYLGLITPFPTSVAIKKIKFAEISENNILEFQREISALMKLKANS